MTHGVRVFFGSLRLVLAIACIVAGPVRAAKPQDETEKKIRLLGEALHARDTGDLLAARKAVDELSLISPKDPTVVRLRAEIEAKMALMKTAADKLAAESAARVENKAPSDGAIEVAIGPGGATADPAKPVPKRVSFFLRRAPSWATKAGKCS